MIVYPILAFVLGAIVAGTDAAASELVKRERDKLARLVVTADRSVGAAAPTPGNAEKRDDVELRVAVRPMLIASEDREIAITLWLVNDGKRAVLVSPVVGQDCRSFYIWARRTSGDDSRILLLGRKTLRGRQPQKEDLFRLMPGRELRREMELTYSDVLRKEGEYVIWAELDCKGMAPDVEDALSAVLESNRAPFRFSSSETVQRP